jgi:hypothetical protein
VETCQICPPLAGFLGTDLGFLVSADTVCSVLGSGLCRRKSRSWRLNCWARFGYEKWNNCPPSLWNCPCRPVSKSRVDPGGSVKWAETARVVQAGATIPLARRASWLAVEMEAAALYAFARARNRPVLCFAHVTNQMSRIEEDFEKGVADGAEESLRVISLAAGVFRRGVPTPIGAASI